MRKGLIVLTLLAFLVALPAEAVLAGVVLKVGPDVAGKMEFALSAPGIPTRSDKENVKMGITVGAEYIFDSGNNLAFGGGFEYQLKREIDKEGDSKFNYIPIYALGRYQLDSFYLTVKAGYNLFQADNVPEDMTVNGGLCYGIGGGTTFADAFQVELLYSVNNGAIKAKDPSVPGEMKYKYSKISLSMGYML